MFVTRIQKFFVPLRLLMTDTPLPILATSAYLLPLVVRLPQFLYEIQQRTRTSMRDQSMQVEFVRNY